MKNLPRTLSGIGLAAYEQTSDAPVGRRIEVTVEREFLSFQRSPAAASFTAFCARCLRDTLLIPIEAAMLAAQLTPREIYRRVEAGRLHFHETPAGQVYICIESLTPSAEPLPPTSLLLETDPPSASD